jgi:ABC-2 type transport system ATP-binding protein
MVMAKIPEVEGADSTKDLAVSVRGLTKKYGDQTAVDSVSFDVRRGETFSLLGPNGAGKTTAIRMLTTVASITDGSATVAGHDVNKNPTAVRNSIGIVPQEVVLDNELKGMENILLAAELHHIPGSIARNRARDLLQLVELEDAAGKHVSTYSGGMKRRLQLVTALIHKPEILFLDEPTVGLDVQTRFRIWDYLQRLNKEDGLTIFMTTHYLEEADHLSHRIAIMDHGVIKVSGSPAELKESLHGDILTLEVTDGAGGNLTEFLEKVDDVVEVSRTGTAYRMKVSKVEIALPAIIAGIASRGLKIKETSFNKPTMDEVFLEVTGRSIRDAEEGSNHPEGSVSRQKEV